MSSSDIFYGTSGPRDAQIMVLGEAWGREELAQKRPFVGASGAELGRMLAEASTPLPLCFRTNVIADRPPDNEMSRFFHPNAEAKANALQAVRGLHPRDNVRASLALLEQQIRAVKPKLIIACGNYALWALTHCTTAASYAGADGAVKVPSGIESWRGSQWYASALPPDLMQTKVLPIIHPAAILRAWYNRACTVHDLRTRIPLALRDAWRPSPPPVVLAPPDHQAAMGQLREWLARADRAPFRLAVDIETNRSLITCIGFADSPSFAISIPLVKNGQLESYFPVEQEKQLFLLIRALLSHPAILVEGQNFSYDTQYFYRYFAVLPKLDFDTMLAHHLLFPGTPKGLDYLSSLYCEHHWYWKDDGKEWNTKGSLSELLQYNALDCQKTFEIATTLRKLITDMGQTEQWEEVKATAHMTQRMMFRGVKIDRSARAEMGFNLATAADKFSEWFTRIIPQRIFTEETGKKASTPWFQSPTQQRNTFANDFGFDLPRDKRTGNITFGKEALGDLTRKHPEFTRLFAALSDFRSIRVFHNTFVKAPLDVDDRMRCAYNVAGTETFRFSSSENAFGSGTNLQNVPKGNEKD